MISVIIPLYNKEPIIERSLQSVLSQDYDDFEVVVINDGSTDRSAEIVRSINDPRIRLIEQENGGPSKARNTGTKNARGEWILFLDADDELLPGALRIFYRLSAEHSEANIIDCVQTVQCGDKTWNDPHELEGYSCNPYKDWYLQRIGPGSNHSIFKRDLLMSCPYNVCFRRYEDAELLMRLLGKSKLYSSMQPVSLVHTEFSAASKVRNNIKTDYVGNLKFCGGFWQKMCDFKLYIEERVRYGNDCEKLYPFMKYRYDLLLLHKIMFKLKRFL